MSFGNGIGDMTGCTCGAYWSVIPPGPCPYHHVAAAPPPQWAWTGIGTTGMPVPPVVRMSDEDVERIARRCAQLMTGGHLPDDK